MDQINLPADLPENLKTGQIIPANGSDRGLPIQYGYNYLMQQVNAAQTAYNNLAEALAVLDVADIKQNIMAGEDGEPVSLEALLRSLNEKIENISADNLSYTFPVEDNEGETESS